MLSQTMLSDSMQSDSTQSDSIGRLHPIDDAVDTCVLALRLMERLHGWVAAQGPPFTARYCPVFGLSTAFVTPWLAPDVLHLGTRIWSWITAVDDLVDGTPTGATAPDPTGVRDVDGLPEGAAESLRRCRAVLHGGAPGDDPLAVALAGIRAEVATLPGFDPLGRRWRDSVERLLAGMRFEVAGGAALARGVPAPPLGEYLDHAVHTVGVPMYLLSLWAAMPPGDPAVLLPALRDAALTVRLANDLRGSEREGVEQNLNVVRLGLTVEQAGRLLRERHDACRTRLAPLLARRHPPAVAVARMATWGARLYQWTDFRFPDGPPDGVPSGPSGGVPAGPSVGVLAGPSAAPAQWPAFDWFVDAP